MSVEPPVISSVKPPTTMAILELGDETLILKETLKNIIIKKTRRKTTESSSPQKRLYTSTPTFKLTLTMCRPLKIIGYQNWVVWKRRGKTGALLRCQLQSNGPLFEALNKLDIKLRNNNWLSCNWCIESRGKMLTNRPHLRQNTSIYSGVLSCEQVFRTICESRFKIDAYFTVHAKPLTLERTHWIWWFYRVPFTKTGCSFDNHLYIH